jgi:glucose 1-dehydrogenase
MSLKLSNKIALVSGAGTGIGQGIAIELAKQGAKVAVHYNSSDAGAKATQQRILELGGECLIVQANVAHKHEIERMAAYVAECFGGIDILVNNAAMQLNIGLLEYDESQYDHMIHVNLKGYWQCMQAVIPFMKMKNSGRIVLISSVHSKRPTDFDPVYAMTKGGMKMLCRESALELARYGITVNAVEPGAVDVGRKSGKPKDIIPVETNGDVIVKPRDVLLRKFPMGRIGTPQDVGQMVSYLCTDAADFITGSSIRMDGASMFF